MAEPNLMKNNFDHSPADTFLLAAFGVCHWPGRPKTCRVLDLGCGPGRLLYEVARVRAGADLYGLELQAVLLQEATEALVVKGMTAGRIAEIGRGTDLGGAIKLAHGDVRRIEAVCAAGSFDVVFVNPPYFRRREGRIPPDPVRARYRHEMDATLEDFLRATEYALAPAGVAFTIYPRSRMERFEAVLDTTRLRIALRQDVTPGRSVRDPYWTLCRLVQREQYRETRRLEPIDDPDAFVGLNLEQDEVKTG